MMTQTELVRYKEVDVCREQLTLTPTEWDYTPSLQERLVIEDVVRRKLFVPIFVNGNRIFYGNTYYKNLRELCGKYESVKAVIFEFDDPIDAMKQFVIWNRLVLRRNVKWREIKALQAILGLSLSEEELRQALGLLSAFVEWPQKSEEPAPQKAAQPQPVQTQTQMPQPPPLEEVLKVKEAVQIAEKLERLGESGRQIIERLDEKKAKKLMPLLAEEQKIDVVSELSKLPEKVLKMLIMLANSPHFGGIVEHLDALYEQLDEVEQLLREAVRRADHLGDVVELLRSKLLNELLRHKEAWPDLAFWLSRYKTAEELLEALQ